MANYKKALFLLCSVIALVLVVGIRGADVSASTSCSASGGSTCRAVIESSGSQRRGVVTANRPSSSNANQSIGARVQGFGQSNGPTVSTNWQWSTGSSVTVRTVWVAQVSGQGNFVLFGQSAFGQ